MDELTAWSRDLTVEVGGHGVVSHTGSAALRLLADQTGLTGALSKALRRRGFTPVHDRGRVLADTAVLIADGGRVMSDLAVLRDQGELFGPVASDPTLWRALEEIGPHQRERVAAARAQTRRHVWGLIQARHGRIPPSRVADRDLGETIVIRMDATIQIAHSDKQQAAGTFKGTWGHHSLTAWCDNTSESLAFRLRPGNAGSNTAVDHIEVLDEAITQLPARHRRNLLITCDGAGATLDLVRHITTLNTAPGRRVHYSVGFDLDARRPHRDQPAGRHRLGPGARPPRHPPRPRRRRRGRADRAAAPLRGRGPAGQLAGGHAHHLPPRTPLLRGAAVTDGGSRRLALPAARHQHPDRTGPVPRSPSPTTCPRGGPHPHRQEHRHRPFALHLVRAQPGLVCGRDHRL